MRQFLYLNTDIVNSIIAQADKGLVDAFTTEAEKGYENNKKKTTSLDLTGEAGASVWKLAKAEASLEVGGQVEGSISNYNATKEIIAKTLHDAAFDIAYDVIKPNIVEHGCDSANPGDYIQMSRVFDFVDLHYLEKMFASDGIVEYLKKMEKQQINDNIDEYVKSMNRDGRRNSSGKQNGVVKELEKQCDRQYDAIHDVILAVGNIVPYDCMLVSDDGYLIPLEDKFFRVNSASLGFMYGGNIRCVGMITNVIGKDTNPNDDSNIFATLQFSINEVLRQILPTKEENIYVVSPIAVFYES